MPRVSVIIPTYNRVDLLPEAVQSVLGQTVSDLELILVDDGSTDGTGAVAAEFLRDPRVRWVHQDNQGRSASRNHGAGLAQGEFLGFLDSDDRYLPSAVEVHLRAFSQRADLGMTIGGYQYVDETGQPLGERCPWDEGGALNLSGWLFNCYAMPGSVLLRRSWLDRMGGFDSNCEIAEDWDLFVRLAQADCSMEWVRECVCQYRQHPGSSVHAVSLHRDGALRMMDKLFRRQGMRPDIVALEKSARAWVYAAFARRAYDYAQTTLAAENLKEALRLDPQLAGSRKVELLEFLISPGRDRTAAQEGLRPADFAHLPPEMKVRQGDVRRALARVEMAQFFAAVGRRSETKAFQAFRTAVRLDPRWLGNRGVWSVLLRSLWANLASISR